MDSAYKLCNIKNLVVVSTEHAKNAFLQSVYPHNIDCIVLTHQEAKKYKGNYKVMFFSCFVKELSHCENIIMDDIIFSTWSPKPNCVRLSLIHI